jgi:hypothetical protein
MNHLLPKIAWISILAATLVTTFHPTTLSAQNAQIRHVAIRQAAGGATEIEIETSRRVVPLTQIVNDPERLVIDFPDAVPGPQLRSLPGNNGEVKGVRAGLFSANPPITRVVLELKSTQDFKLLPSSHSVVVRLGGGANAAASASTPEPASAPAPTSTPAPAKAPAPMTAALAPARMSASSAPPTPAPVSLPSSTKSSRPKVVPDLSSEPASVGKTAQLRRVSLLKVGGAIEIEIEASLRIVPAVQVVTGPDRLVLDFSDATPGPQVRAFAVNQGEVKGVRVGLLSSKPPVTRVVLDLKSPQAYQLFPLGKSVIVKLGGPVGIAETPQSATPEVAAAPAPAPEKKVAASYQNGLLSITSNRGSLADVLNEIHLQTGADIAIPAGAEQEEVAVSLGPAPPRDVVAKLLDGSHYNFIIVGADGDISKLGRVILSLKGAGNMSAETQPLSPEPVPVAVMQPMARSVGPEAAPPPPPPPDDPQPQGDSIPPDTTPQPDDPQAPPN